MFEMNVPYDKGQMKIKLEDKNLAGVLEGRQSDYKTTLSENEIVEQSLDNPIGSKSLEELAKDKKNIVIISSDHTRPVPSKIITPILLRRIRSVSPDARIRILVATGFHRESTHEELVAKYGEEIVKNEEIVMHVSTDDSSMVKIGQLPSGGDCIINKVAAEADLLMMQALLKPTSLQDSQEEENQCCQVLLLIKPLWQIIVVNLSMIKNHVQEICSTI